MEKICVVVDNKKSLEKFIESYGQIYVSSDKKEENNKDGIANNYVIHISSYDMFFMGKSEEKESLSYLDGLLEKIAFEKRVIRSNNVKESVVDFIKKENITMAYIDGESKSHYIRETVTALELELNIDITVF